MTDQHAGRTAGTKSAIRSGDVVVGAEDGCPHGSLAHIGTDKGKNTFLRCEECSAILVKLAETAPRDKIRANTGGSNGSNRVVDALGLGDSSQRLSDGDSGENYSTTSTAFDQVRSKLSSILP